MQIKNNVQNLSEEEKAILSKAKYFSYVYGNGLILIQLNDNTPISWNCSNSTAAKKYLENLGIRELL
jgi:hypothetical protein